MPRARRTPAPARQRGFTLVELMVVIALIGVIVRVALFNMGALVPSTILDGECKQLRSHLDFLRSESRLRGQPHSLELDLTNGRYRYVFPPERQLVWTPEEEKDVVLGWTPLDDSARFTGVAQPGMPPLESGLYRVTFDENGNTGDLAIFLRLTTEGDERVWTLQLRGLTGRSDIVKNFEGRPAPLEAMNEAAF